ncbi:hypothetical protein L4X63_17495 [Geomonas sp. Red32]|uniref:hypothetical protein n=1 Tax=Geomonas sp. Red32 TaxID=2912856 RepID=UPI00202CFF21|nr:hypothetical protein [Geomonas sp. Red32]MCM0083382.1 hypothetical protein [Geomonas sp. Red32]
MKQKRQTGLRLIRGGRHGIRLGLLEVMVSPPELPPFTPEATVVEEDTWLVLSAEPAVKPVAESVVRIMTELIDARAVPPGSVLVKKGDPVQVQAVVYDLGEEPLCRPEWVSLALKGIFAVAEERPWTAMAMPPLGVRFGRLPLSRFVELLAEAVRDTPLSTLRRIWLTVEEDDCPAARRELLALAGPGDEEER